MDIIARKGEILDILEFKSRKSTYIGDPQSFVSKKQHRSHIVAAGHFVNTNNLDVKVRFDIVSQSKNIKLQIIENVLYPF